MEHQIWVEEEVPAPAGLAARLEEAVNAALDAEGVDVPCVVEVCLTDDEAIHQTNLEMRGVDRPTDVLSFPMFELQPGEKPRAEWADPDTDRVLLGDMMISLERARAQAEEYGHPVLSIDRPYNARSSGQLRTRMQAFVESLEIKRIQKKKQGGERTC